MSVEKGSVKFSSPSDPILLLNETRNDFKWMSENECVHDDENYECTRVVLHDFNEIFHCVDEFDHSSVLAVPKLREKLNHQQFSLQFHHVQTLGELNRKGSLNSRFNYPIDVKIGYHLNCLIVSDSTNKRLQFFDLTTKEYQSTLSLPFRPAQITVQEGSFGNCFVHIYITESEHGIIHKYDLRKFVQEEYSNLQDLRIWSTSESIRQTPHLQFLNLDIDNLEFDGGTCIEQFNAEFHTSVLYVCSNQTPKRIFVLNCENGHVLKIISLTNSSFKQMSAIHLAPTQHMLLIVDSMAHHLKLIDKNSGTIVKIIGKYGGGASKGNTKPLHFSYPRNLCIDYKTHLVYICDSANNRIQVLHLAEKCKFVKEFGNQSLFNMSGRFKTPSGICMNEQSGELIVADTQLQRVQIFR
ncbi:hypothetical protein C9374_009501 [Naegleria lovaniensis]|uniref:Uncharacterized protein n=1 Tax=Naegleria lovaniensis TaxID=51637 RepID=A0AA88GYI9_NAELO|nr:uncharacterized protein C9374_009501 [Naegleria lovaniensis]KAG2392924.1 hypothetical protein C9374_009501 [Naegleria lovaniensis]